MKSMKQDADAILDRIKLKQNLRKWQVFAIVALLLFLLTLVGMNMSRGNAELKKMREDYIARVELSGIILDDPYREKVLAELAEDKHAKAVIFNIDSPGGTTVGGEALYGELRKLSDAGKPVVVVQRTLAASAGYMASIAGDRIYARKGTITGSIGVLAQSAEITDLAERLGIKLETFKSAELKASPSPFEKTTPKSAAAMQAVIDDFYNFFVDLVAERRKLSPEKARELSDGRVYTGRQALANGLIDAIGGEEDAKKWLQTEKKLPKSIKVEDIEIIEPEKTLTEKIFGKPERSQIYQRLNLSGLLAIWHP